MRRMFTIDLYNKIMLTVIAGCLLWRCLFDVDLVSHARAQEAREQLAHERVIEAEEFRLVDKSGKLRALLTVHPGKKAEPYYEDKPGLYLYNQQGFPSGVFNLSDNRPSVYLRDGKGSVALGVTKCQPNGDQGGVVTVADAAGRGAVLGVLMDYHKGPGPASSLKLFGKMFKEVIWEAPRPSSPEN